MSSSRDQEIIELWLAKQSSPHTRSCYRRDVARILSCSAKSRKRITPADMQRFAQSLEDTGLAPISRARTLAAIKSLFGSASASGTSPRTRPPSRCCRYENRLSERIVGEGAERGRIYVRTRGSLYCFGPESVK